MFITFEGSEGSGKTSQIPDLAGYLRGLGREVRTTREPGGTSIGNQVRTILNDLDNAENFLDDGNCIINTADWMFYVSNGGNNGGAGLQNMMDAPSADMSGAGENIQQTITADGLLYTPSLQPLQTDRPFHLDTLTSEWEVELLLAQDTTGNLVDPVIVRNTVTNGRIGIFYQTAGQDNDPHRL